MAIYADNIDTTGPNPVNPPDDSCYPPVIIRKPDNSAFRYFKQMNGAEKEMRRNNKGIINGC